MATVCEIAAGIRDGSFLNKERETNNIITYVFSVIIVHIRDNFRSMPILHLITTIEHTGCS